jgi:hypothetical protein
MMEEEKKYVDGCAIFWKRDKWAGMGGAGLPLQLT